MRILFDARGVQARSDGMSNYVRAILAGLLSADRETAYTILLTPAFRSELQAAGLLERSNVRAVETSIPFMGAAQQVWMPALVRRLGPSHVYHYPHFDLPTLAHPNSVVTIYDLNHINFPAYFGSQRRLKRWYSWVTTHASARRARHVITISEHTKRQLLERFTWLTPGDVTVTHFGVEARFLTPPAPERLRAFRQKFALGDARYLLYVGTHRPHKNLERVVKAYAQLRGRGEVTQQLLLVGSPGGSEAVPRLVRALRLEDAVRLIGYVPDEELPLVYRVADAFVFCSLSEGFGMPLLEAMASGVPVVSSAIGAMAEIAADSALLVDPYSIERIAEGMATLAQSDAARRAFAARGAERVQRFSWDDAVARTLGVYRAVAGDQPGAPALQPETASAPAAG